MPPSVRAPLISDPPGVVPRRRAPGRGPSFIAFTVSRAWLAAVITGRLAISNDDVGILRVCGLLDDLRLAGGLETLLAWHETSFFVQGERESPARQLSLPRFS